MDRVYKIQHYNASRQKLFWAGPDEASVIKKSTKSKIAAKKLSYFHGLSKDLCVKNYEEVATASKIVCQAKLF